MSNPLGGSGAGAPEDRNEFIEIFNKGHDTVDIYNWIITDFDSEDYIFPFSILSDDSNTVILPGAFALILDPEYIDSGENYMPYGVPECILLTVGNTTIGNGLTTNDSIALISPEGDTVSTYYNPFNAGNGISVERISPYTGDIPENWGSCKDSTGSTPGFENSIFSPPDFKIDTLFVEECNINLWLKNISDTTISGTVNIFNDLNRNRNFEQEELINSYHLVEIRTNSIIKIQFYIENEGVYSIGIQLLNKTIYRKIRINHGISNLIINEVMYAPIETCEWIELHNRSIYDFYIDSLLINREVLPKRIQIPPGEFIILANDSSSFFAYYGNIPAPLLKVNLSLSNNGDSVNIYDENGFLLDRCIYNANDAERNYSLEKVSPDIYSGNLSNWGQSLFQGGTPGLCNSIFAPYKVEDTSLLVTPDHFTPNEDGMNENCVISFELPYIRNNVNIRIFDRRGHLLIEKNGFFGGERGEWIWNGRDRKGNIVGTGLYIVFLSVYDMDNNNSSIRKTVVSVGK
jgi:hypothetical protein